MTIESDREAGHWLTYAEISAALSKSLPATQQHVRRRKWKRQQSNHPHDLARFWVPEASLPVSTGKLVSTGKPTSQRTKELLNRAWDQLFRDREKLFQDLETARASIRELETILENVRQDKSRLEAQLREPQTWGLWVRLAWALRRKP